MKKIVLVLLMILVGGLLSLRAQSVNFKLGAFYPGAASDLWETNFENLSFSRSDMMGTYFGAELEVFMGRNFSLAVEGGRYKKNVYTVYSDVEYDDGTPLYQDISLGITSLEADIKIYPMGHRKEFNPYIGGGFGFYFWKYYQGGDFYNWMEDVAFEGEAYTDRITPGFNAKAGFVYRLRRTFGISLETKYTYVKGELSQLFEDFEKFDLGGFTFTAGIHLFLR